MYKIYMIDIKEIISNRELLIYILVSSAVIYFLFNFITSVLKYPVILVLGVIVGKMFYTKNVSK